MNETQQEVIQKLNSLFDKLIDVKELNQVDELKLVLVKKHLEESHKLVDSLGEKVVLRIR